MEEIIKMFSLDKAGKSGALFDEGKLKWLNATYIRNCDIDKLTELLLPFIKEAGYDVDLLNLGWLHQVVEALRDNLVTLADVGLYLDIFFDDRYRISEEARAILREGAAVVKVLHEELERNNVADRDSYPNLINSVRRRTSLRAKDLFLPIRAALTGRTSGPELEKVFAILGKESILGRLERAIHIAI
jgi:nondiscriminating glutamyl-tRNA synthetase